jgi:hypothetical protein
MQNLNPDLVMWINKVMAHKSSATKEELKAYFIDKGLTESLTDYILSHWKDYQKATI